MINKMKNKIIPILFSSMIVLSSLGTFTTSLHIYIIPVVFMVGFTIFICTIANGNNKFSFIYYLLSMLVIVGVSAGLINLNTDPMSFFSWVMYGNLSPTTSFYFFAFFLLGSFFITSATYYFTFIVFRQPVLLLLIFFPSLLYKQKLIMAPAIEIIGFLVLYLLLVYEYSSGELQEESVVIKKGILEPILFAAGVFIFSAIVMLLLPDIKPSSNQLSSKFNRPFLFGYSGSSGGSSSSSPKEQEDEVLYLVESQEPMYLVRQVFGSFTGKEWLAIEEEELTNEFKNWEYSVERKKIDCFIEMVKKSKGTVTSNNLRVDLLEGVTPKDIVATASILPLEYPTQYVLAPMRTFHMEGMEQGKFNQNRLGEVFREGGRTLPAKSRYNLSYYKEIIRENSMLQEFFGSVDPSKFVLILEELHTENMDDKELSATLDLLYDEFTYGKQIQDTYKDLYYNESLKQLANELTQHLDNNYDKAQALENYFNKGDFTYDAEFIPPADANVDYFVLESKRGTCTDFASAMTYMAKSIGLNARYVGGFSVHEEVEPGKYIVRMRHAHAFPQVFFPALGWVTFEPTVSQFFTEEPMEEFVEEEPQVSIIKSVFTFFSVVIVGGAFLVVFYVYYLKERLFRWKVKMKSPTHGVLLLYNRALQMGEKAWDITNMNSTEFREESILRLEIDIINMSHEFERVMFNDEILTGIEKEEANKTYLEFYEAMRKKKEKTRETVHSV